MTWERTFAHATAVNRQIEPAAMQSVGRQAYMATRRALKDAGWTERDLSHPSAPNIMLLVARDHADWWTKNLVVVMAEVRALDLRTADPLPEKMPLWSRRRRVR